MADAKMEADKKKLATENEARAKATAEHHKIYDGKPTPTQEEADLIKLGHHPELEPDGSTDPDAATKEAGKQPPYQTREARATTGGGATGATGAHRQHENKSA